MLKLGLVPLIAASLLAQDARLEHDGAYWVRTLNAPVSMGQSTRLRVATRGHVILRGAPGDQVTFTLTEHVKARSEVEAHRMFGNVKTITRTLPDATTFVVEPMAADNVILELQINIPRGIASTILNTRAGDIEAYDLEGSLQLETTAGLIRCDRIHGGVVGRTGGGEIRLGKIGGQVRCLSGGGSIFVDSAGGDANCHTMGGEIVVQEAAGSLVLSTDGGNIRVFKAASSVEAHTSEGVIEVAQAGGTVFADTRGGSIQVGSARGVKCESGAGAIRVKTSSSPLRISTAMGSILAELLAGTHLDDSSLVARAGDVTVMIPSNLALSVMAQNDSGGKPRIVSDFSEFRTTTFGVARPAVMAEGAINGGGPVLRINVADGTIYLRRLK
jgi:DUF4097 and DUF4098 domain-containing protein YvlB